MSLLREIQASILDANSEIGSILLKLRFLASRLGSAQLEEWVKHEAEGYPVDVDVPEYRRLSVSFRGVWSGPFGSGVKNAPIPPYLVEKYAGKSWTKMVMRESIAAVDELATGESDSIYIDTSNLILKLQGKVYPHFSCLSVEGEVSKHTFREIQNSVRNRVLNLTIELEKAVPSVVEVKLGESVTDGRDTADAVTHVFHQTIYGSNTTVSNTGDGAQVNLAITIGDGNSLVQVLENSGIPKEAAREFAETLASEEPDGPDRPLGERARKWLARNIGKAADGTCSNAVLWFEVEENCEVFSVCIEIRNWHRHHRTAL